MARAGQAQWREAVLKLRADAAAAPPSKVFDDQLATCKSLQVHPCACGHPCHHPDLEAAHRRTQARREKAKSGIQRSSRARALAPVPMPLCFFPAMTGRANCRCVSMQLKSQKEAILLFLQAAVREKLIRPGRYCDSDDAARYHTFSLALSHSDARRARAHLLSLSLSLSLSHTHTHTVTHTQIHTNTSRAHSRAIPVALLAGLRSPSSQGMPSIRRTNVGGWMGREI